MVGAPRDISGEAGTRTARAAVLRGQKDEEGQIRSAMAVQEAHGWKGVSPGRLLSVVGWMSAREGQVDADAVTAARTQCAYRRPGCASTVRTFNACCQQCTPHRRVAAS